MGPDRPADAAEDFAPPAAPLPMPRQCLEAPRSGRDRLIFGAAAPRRG